MIAFNCYNIYKSNVFQEILKSSEKRNALNLLWRIWRCWSFSLFQNWIKECYGKACNITYHYIHFFQIWFKEPIPWYHTKKYHGVKTVEAMYKTFHSFSDVGSKITKEDSKLRSINEKFLADVIKFWRIFDKYQITSCYIYCAKSDLGSVVFWDKHVLHHEGFSYKKNSNPP